ncbi:MAG: bifunctional phosphoribosylaminoimidazolecarboxamide formyltransferase/IMP cyclohydrolase [Bacteroidetes bacterium 4572_117]|nr:MAG: bifunctional phosphoribosylaminoimidazolecarboxamide formyltransferase/IMP cyclohydrolase [Bacteroidetes bacterium 4572_117]
MKKIKSALISVYHKDNLENIVQELKRLGIEIYSTGGTKSFIEGLGVDVQAVEDVTSYPSILGGRVKTLHPKIFGGILSRRDNPEDNQQVAQYKIPFIDLVIVDLYPFEGTVKSGANEADVIEKIDIGGISLIRAAAKNFKDVVIVPSKAQYTDLLEILKTKNGETNLDERKMFAKTAFKISSSYDSAIYSYLASNEPDTFAVAVKPQRKLRYGENPHQAGYFYGNFNELFEQLHGKEISYNNLLDIEAAVNLISEFADTTFAVLKHNNACGLAVRDKLVDAWKDALAGDPISAFGGVLITNKEVDTETAEEIDKIFYEVLIAPSYSKGALDILKAKKNRIILIKKDAGLPKQQFRSLLNGVLVQDKDQNVEFKKDMKLVTSKTPSENQYNDLAFANILVKHSKSNSIVLAKNMQLIASGVGQTSRIDALKHAIEKAVSFDFDLQGAVMASDAFFPFADSVEIANNEGIDAVIQPGGSIRDKDSINYCDEHNMAMVFTGIRHFKH